MDLNVQMTHLKTIEYLEKNKLGKKKLILDLKIGEFQDKDIGVPNPNNV